MSIDMDVHAVQPKLRTSSIQFFKVIKIITCSICVIAFWFIVYYSNYFERYKRVDEFSIKIKENLQADHSNNFKINSKKDILKKTSSEINKIDFISCHKSYVFHENNEKFQFIDMVDDEKLQNSDGQNIIFHVTNCIHDGIPIVNSRLIYKSINL